MNWHEFFEDNESPLEIIPTKEERKSMASWEIMLLVGIAVLLAAWVVVERLF